MRILVVEDEQVLCDGIAEDLELEKYTADRCYDGEDAYERLSVEHYDLVILDVSLPDGSGYDLCREIRKTSRVPVIFLTAADEETDIIMGLDMGGDDYITKPFSVKLVLMRVEAVLRRVEEHKTQVSENILTYENVRLDQAAHLVSVDGNSVALTNTEYELLELFLLHPGRVFSRDHLLNQVWGYDIACEEKTVNIHIMNLRRKLGTNIIETIRGVGYRLGKED